MLNKIKKAYKAVISEKVNIYIAVFFIFLLILSFFRDAYADETLYLRETMIISELLKRGVWVGGYGVGTHGFLFKIPVAIFFIIIGSPSVFVATLFTISISIACLILFSKILKAFFFSKKWELWTIIVFSMFLYFINMSVSYNRDIPAIFTVLLFVYLFLRKSNKWLIGLILLLMLDAKEHVFLTVAPLYGLYVVIEGISSLKEGGWKRTLGRVFEQLFSGYYMCFIWLVLMFATSIIPMNMFWASIFGFTEGKGSWVAAQFSTEYASSNLMDEGGKEIFKISDQSLLGPYMSCENDSAGETETSNVDCRKKSLFCWLIKLGDTVLSYVGKVLYPRTFSFISIPKLIILPTIVMSVRLFAIWWRKKDRRYILPLILFFNVLMIIFRASHGRYLLAVAPLVSIFFIYFFKDCIKKERFFRKVVIATTIFEILGLYFESTFVLPKIVLTIGLLVLLWSVYIFRKHKWNTHDLAISAFLGVLSFSMMAVALQFSYSIGQISEYLKYGYNRETKIVAENLDDEKKVWVNSFGSDELLRMYRKDLGDDPEWHWKLSSSVPKKYLLKIYSPQKTFSDNIINITSFHEYIKSNDIEQISLVVSSVKGKDFPSQKYLADLLLEVWLQYDRKVVLKNKDMYIFTVVE